MGLAKAAGRTGHAMFLALTASAVLTAHAQANIVISTAATAHMSCAEGVCTPTASSATFNVNDLQTALATGNLELSTGTVARDIDVRSSITWSSAKTLTLDANHSIVVSKAIKVKGHGGLILATNDGGNGGLLQFDAGNVSFAFNNSPLTINGQTFKLEGGLTTLANAVRTNSSGSYALMGDIDASKNGTFAQAPIGTLNGAFNGLGHTVSNLSISDSTASDNVALFAQVGATGSVADVFVLNANVSTPNGASNGVAVIVGSSAGTVSFATATGTVGGGTTSSSGGVVGENGGKVFGDYANVTVNEGRYVGGLVGLNLGGSTIDQSAGVGSITASDNGFGGGLVGGNFASVTNCFAWGNVTVGVNAYGGGLIGDNFSGNADTGIIKTSYSTGTVTGTSSSIIGLSAGFNNADPPLIKSVIVDITRSSLTTRAKRGAPQANGKFKFVGDGDSVGFSGLTTKGLDTGGIPAHFNAHEWADVVSEFDNRDALVLVLLAVTENRFH